MGRKAGGKDFSPRVRSIVDQVLDKMQKSGDARKLLESQFKKDFAGTLRAVSAYVPKQVDMTLDQKITVDTTEVSKEDMAIIRSIKEAQESSVTH